MDFEGRTLDFEGCTLDVGQARRLIASGILPNGDECVICCKPLVELDPATDQLTPGQEATSILLDCGHAFHANCIIGWGTHIPVCPLDNIDIVYKRKDAIPELHQGLEPADAEPGEPF